MAVSQHAHRLSIGLFPIVLTTARGLREWAELLDLGAPCGSN